MTYLFFDTETTGVPYNYNAPVTDTHNWPRLVQLGWILTDEYGSIIKQRNRIIRPSGFTIPQEASNVHGITTERALAVGLDLEEVLLDFETDVQSTDRIVGHNISFDIHIIGAELCRLGHNYNTLLSKPFTCTMQSTIDFCQIPPFRYGHYKWPKLQELYQKLFGCTFDGAHDAMADITATKDCFFELKNRRLI